MTGITPQQIVLAGDSARARRDDPLTSHRAADRSQASKRHVADAVMVLIGQEGSLPGSELNRLYSLRAPGNGWPENIHFDSPRKRAGELVVDGLLVVLNEGDPRGTEHEYALSAYAEQVSA